MQNPATADSRCCRFWNIFTVLWFCTCANNCTLYISKI